MAACAANNSAPEVSTSTKWAGSREYKLSAPSGSPVADNGNDRVDRTPCPAAAAANSGHRSSRAVSSIRTTCWVENASRHGPRPDSYCPVSIATAVASVNAPVRGLPSTSMVIPAMSADNASPVNSVTRVNVSANVESPPTKNWAKARILLASWPLAEESIKSKPNN